MVNKKIAFVIALTIVLGCKVLPLQTPLIENSTNTLKIQGYYFSSIVDKIDKNNYHSIVLYKNGVLKN
jgi:hypothetical protein